MELLEQIVIVLGKSESFHIDEAFRRYFISYKHQYSEAFGQEYWDKCLDSVGHVDRLKNRRKRPIA